MLTVCPKCTLTLAVTTTDLRTGQGYVRCGRCATVFNALVALSEDSLAGIGNTQPNPVLTLPEESANDSAPLTDQVTETAPSEAVADNYLVESTGTGTLETIVLEGDGVLQTEEFVDIETIDSEIGAAARRHFEEAANSSEPEIVTPLQRTRALIPDAAVLDEEEAPATDVLAGIAVSAPLSRSRASPLWGGVAVALLLLLGAQLIHHWRNDLATGPAWFAALGKPYRMLGQPLTPNYDLTGYDLRQLGASAAIDADKAIRVRISLANRAANDQPFPVVRLSFFNRYGKPVAVRDLQPHDYLQNAAAEQSFMKVSQRVDTEVGVPDPGPDASSFELDVCVAAATGLRCANDEPLRTLARS